MKKRKFSDIYSLLKLHDKTTNKISAKLVEKCGFQISNCTPRIQFSMKKIQKSIYLKNCIFDFSEIFTHVRGVLGASFGIIKKGGLCACLFSIREKQSFLAKKRKREENFKIFFGGPPTGLETNLHTKFQPAATYSLGDLRCDRQRDRGTTVKHNTHPLSRAYKKREIGKKLEFL